MIYLCVKELPEFFTYSCKNLIFDISLAPNFQSK
jgi:hypothetical protein